MRTRSTKSSSFCGISSERDALFALRVRSSSPLNARTRLLSRDAEDGSPAKICHAPRLARANSGGNVNCKRSLSAIPRSRRSRAGQKRPSCQPIRDCTPSPRLARGIVTFLATYRHTQRPLMPPAGPVDTSFSATVARNVTIHRASRWHSRWRRGGPCSEERNDPPGQPVAFKMASTRSL